MQRTLIIWLSDQNRLYIPTCHIGLGEHISSIRF